MSEYAKQYFKQAQNWTVNEASDAMKELQKAAGLGARPDVVPPGEALVSGEPRTVELGWVRITILNGRLLHAALADQYVLT
jgi:hypothetical protein